MLLLLGLFVLLSPVVLLAGGAVGFIVAAGVLR
jgi:hypothetical protein